MVSPYGQQTALAVDSNGYLSTITDPAGDARKFNYSSGGLMASMTTPNNNVHNFTYDALGRLTNDSDPAGGFSSLARTDGNSGFSVAVSTASGRTTTYDVEDLPAGGRERDAQYPDGSAKSAIEGPDGSTTMTLRDGSQSYLLEGPDPRFGMLAPVDQSEVDTPGGLSLVTSEARAVTMSDPLNLLSLTSQTDTTTINGQNYTRSFNASNKTFTLTTPSGRSTASTIDSLGRTTASQTPGLYPTSYTYDSHGRLAAVATGTGTDMRTATLSYNSGGLLSALTDPLGRVTGFQYDAAGRVVSKIAPDGSVTSFTHDGDGNLTSITPPGRPAHIFSYTPLDQDGSYVAPVSGSYVYSYDKDRELTGVTFPSGKKIVNAWGNSGLASITTPEGEIDLSYLPGSRISTITEGQESITYGYDGSLLTSETLSGTINQQIGYTYDNNFRLSGLSYAGRSIAYAYDNDGLLTQAGDFTISRNAANGLPEAVTVYLPPNYSASAPAGVPKALAADPVYNRMFASALADEDVATDAGHPKVLLSSRAVSIPVGLSIQGPAALNSGSTAGFSATCTFSDGSWYSGAPATFTLGTTSAATITSGGTLTSNAVTSDQTVTINASYTSGGVTVTASMNVTIVAPGSPVLPASLAVVGPIGVSVGTTASYTANLTYSDGTSKAVDAAFSLSPTTYATITSGGAFSAGPDGEQQGVVINASYTENGITVNGSLDVELVPCPTGLTIQGPLSVNSGSTANFTAICTFSDGSSSWVPAAFTLGTTSAATINSYGQLTAGQVTSDQTVTINASYTGGTPPEFIAYTGASKTASASSALTSTTGGGGGTGSGPTVSATLTVAIVAPNSPPLPASLAVSGASSVPAGETSNYTATLVYSDGSSKAVDAAFSLSPTTFATITSNGALSAGANGSGQMIAVNASWTESGLTVNGSLNVWLTSPLTGLTIQGYGSVNMMTSSTYTARATYGDGSSQNVNATFTLASTTAAAITSAGVLSAGYISANQAVTVDATYSEGGVTVNGSLNVQILVVPVSALTIQGPSSVDADGTATYSATAIYKDGTTRAVSATFTLNATTGATISSAGVLSAGAVPTNRTVTVNASYTEGGITETASQNVQVVGCILPVSLTINGPATVNRGADWNYSATATYDDGSSKAVNAVFS